MAITTKPRPRETSFSWLSPSGMDSWQTTHFYRTLATRRPKMFDWRQNRRLKRWLCSGSQPTPLCRTWYGLEIRLPKSNRKQTREPTTIAAQQTMWMVLAPAWSSTQEGYFLVVPQCLTPLAALALSEAEKRLIHHLAERTNGVFSCVQKLWAEVSAESD